MILQTLGGLDDMLLSSLLRRRARGGRKLGRASSGEMSAAVDCRPLQTRDGGNGCANGHPEGRARWPGSSRSSTR
jgi:hypothetical protein